MHTALHPAQTPHVEPAPESPASSSTQSSWSRPDIPIVEGSFSLTEPGSYDIQGTFDGDTASGEATFTTDGVDCTGQWQASPSM
jgi:hypothetical protein